MKKKERENYKRDRIYNLYVYGHMTLLGIADHLNNDPEFVRKCGKITRPTIAYWIKKIKAEMENLLDGDGLERFTSEFIRASEFIDGEIASCTKMLESDSLKDDDRIKIMNMRHRFKVDQMTLLSDRELPLTVKKYKKDRAMFTRNLKPINEEKKELPQKWPEDTQV